jgi:hypothetical protein
MYIRIDLSVFFVTQNVGETSGVFTERKANFLGEETSKRNFSGEESLFATWQTFIIVGIIKSRRRKKRLLLSKKMLKIWQRVSVIIIL